MAVKEAARSPGASTTGGCQHVKDAGDHPSVVDALSPGWFLGGCGSIAADASSDNQNSAMRHLP